MNKNNRFASCSVNDGTRTGNACLKSWFNDTDITPAVLIAKPDADKVRGAIRITYQVPENVGEECGTTLEPAFILANPDLFTSTPLDERDPTNLPKSQFALKYAVEELNWEVPKYIKDGMFWLAGHNDCESSQIATTLQPPISDRQGENTHA